MSNDLVKFNTILGDMADTFERKNSDYGNSFKESLDEDGLIAAKVRMMDKMRRFSNLISSEAQVKDESIIDTLKDLANYAVMTAMYIEDMGDDILHSRVTILDDGEYHGNVGVVTNVNNLKLSTVYCVKLDGLDYSVLARKVTPTGYDK